MKSKVRRRKCGICEREWGIFVVKDKWLCRPCYKAHLPFCCDLFRLDKESGKVIPV